MLETAGHSLVLAGNGVQALRLLEEQSFDLIFTDIQMPELDGFETTAAIRNKERQTGKHVRIIAMTAHAMTGDRERCLNGGMDGYITKPLRIETLLQMVQRHLPSLIHT